MNSSSMISRQQSDSGLWQLRQGESMRLEIGPGVRRLRLRDGRLWLTGQGATDAPPEDVWLRPGDDVVLQPGAQVVAEGWPQASFELLVPPQACTATAGRDASWWSRLGLPA